MELSIHGFKTVITKYKAYFKSSFLYLFSSLFTSVVGIAVNPLMAKNLSPEDYAIMGYFNSFSLIVLPILNFSLISYYLRNYYRIDEERRQIVSDTILIALLVYGFAALLVTCGAFYGYCRWSNISFDFYPYALMTFAPIYLGNFLIMFLAKCRLEGDAGRFSVVTIANALSGTILAILLVAICQYGATGRLLATLLTSLVTGAYCFTKLLGKLQFDFAVIKDAFRFGWPLSVSAMLWYFLSGIDRAMLDRLNDSHTLGFYNVGVQIAAYFGIFYTAVAQTFEPDIYKAIAENNKGKLVKIISVIIALNAIPNIIFIVFAPFIIGILTYNRYIDSSLFAQILALKNITVTLYYSTITVIVGYGFTKTELLIRVAGSVLCVIMFKQLIDLYGFYGAAWGQVISFIIMSVLSAAVLFYQIRKNKLSCLH